MIINPKIVKKESLVPLNLTKAQVLCIYKLIEIMIIYENKNLMLAVLEVMANVLNISIMAKSF